MDDSLREASNAHRCSTETAPWQLVVDAVVVVADVDAAVVVDVADFVAAVVAAVVDAGNAEEGKVVAAVVAVTLFVVVGVAPTLSHRP